MQKAIGATKQVWALPLEMLMLLCMLAGCGGGGGGGGEPGGSIPPEQVLSGVAAAGAPVIGYAWLKDSAGAVKGPTEIADDGSFGFNVTGLSAPFYLVAKGSVGGQGYEMHSAISSAGTANINPLTNIAVAAAAGVSDPASVYANPAAHPITQDKLDQAIADIRKMLKPLLDAYNANVNPITGAYKTDHTGLDGVFDVVQVSLDTTTGTVTFTDKTTNQSMGSTTTTTIAAAAPVTDVPSTQTLKDLQDIAAMLAKYAETLNKGAGLSASDLEPFFASNYGISNGLPRKEVINFVVMLQSYLDYIPIQSMSNLCMEGKEGGGLCHRRCYASGGRFGVFGERPS